MMALTKSFRETIGQELKNDRAFRLAYLGEAVGALHAGDLATGKAMLRNFINGTLGFGNLGKAVHTSPKSLMRMLSIDGHPQAERLFAILSHLQEQEKVEVRLLPVTRKATVRRKLRPT